MSEEQKDVYVVNEIALSKIALASIVAALALFGALFVAQV